MQPIVRARVEDYAQMVELGNYCFRREKGAIEQRWCHVWGGHLPESSEEFLKNFFLVKEGRQIVGMIAIVPLMLNFGSDNVPAGGVTAVATHPLYRGKGIMSALLEWAEQEMVRRGDVISLLGGDRCRYSHFGWEPVGRRCELCYPPQYLSALPEPETRPVRIRASASSESREVLRHFRRRGYSLLRSEERLALLMRRRGCEFWGIASDAGLSCYLAGLDSTICEYGGDAGRLPGLVKHFARMHDFQEISILTPARFGPEEELLYSLAGSFRISAMVSLKILSLRRLLSGLLPVLQERSVAVGPGFQATLVLRETGESVCLRSADGKIEISEATGGNECCFDRHGMARVLFGPFAEELIGARSQGRPLAELLPLELCISKIDMV
jgi:GNAT superfamily N-acetyltransferase